MFSHSSGQAAHAPTDRFLSIGEAAERYRVSISGLRLWTRQGRLRCYRKGGSALSHRVFREADLIEFFSRCGNFSEESREAASINENSPAVALVARVSSHPQASDLQRQASRLEQWIEKKWGGNAKVERFVGVRSGLNFSHPQLVALIQGICERRFKFLVVTHRERLARTAFNLINTLCQIHGTEIIVTENEVESDPQQELVSVLLAITHYYSTKLYSARSIKTNTIALPDDVVRQIVEMHAAGHSQNVIFDSLKQAGKNKGNDGREFSIHVVRRVIKRHAKLAPVLARSTDSHASPALRIPRHGKPCSFQTFWEQNVRLGSPAAKLSRTTLIQTYRRWAVANGAKHVNTPKEITKWMKCRMSHLLKFHIAARKAGSEIVYTGLWIGEVDA